MNQRKPCKRRDFIRNLRQFGFDEPYSGTRHQFILFQNHRLAIPSNDEYSVPQLRMMIQESEEIIGREISVAEWKNL